MDVATLRAILSVDSTQFNKGMDAAERRLQNFGQQQKPTTLDVGTDAALKKIDELAAKINALKNSKTTVTVNTPSRGSVLSNRGVDKDTARIYRDWNSALAENERRLKAATKATDGMGRSVQDAGNWLSRAKEMLVGFAVGYVVIGGLTKLIGGLKSAVIDYNSSQQQTLIGFTSQLDGSRKAAQALYTDLQKFNDLSPFREEQILPVAQKFLAAKMTPVDVKSAMYGAGEQTAGLGGNEAKLGQISTALTQIWIKPRLQLEELTQQLIEHGVPAFDLLAKAYGTNTTQIQEWISKGMIPGKEAARALWTEMARANPNAMLKQSRSFTGALSTLGDLAKRKIGGAFKQDFDDLTESLNKLVYVAQNKDFQAWLDGVADKARVGLSFVTGLFSGLVSEVERGNPVLVGALAFLGAKFVWLAAGPILKSFLPAAQFVIRLIPFMAAQFLALPTPLLIAGAAIAAFAVAYHTNFLGVKDVTDSVVSFVVDGIKTLSWSLASLMEKTSGILQKIPDRVLAATPGGGVLTLALKKMLGDQTGLADSVMDYWEGVDRTWAKGKAKFQSTFSAANIGKIYQQQLQNLSSLNPLSGMDFDKWTQGYEKAVARLGKGGSVVPAYDPKLGPPRSNGGKTAEEKAESERLRVLKDQLSDSARMYDMMAKAAEDSAKRQITALTGVRDTMRELFGSMQSALLKEGVTSNPLGSMIEKFQAKLGIEAKMKNITAATAHATEYFTGKANAARGQIETQSGLDGVVPARQGSGTLNLKQTASEATNAMMLAMGKSFSSGEPYLSCAFVASRLANAVGANVKTTASAGGLRANAIKAGWTRADPNNIQQGDLIFNRRKGGSGWHVKTGANDGMVVNSNHRQETMYRYRPKAGDEVYRAPSMGQPGVLPKNPSYVPRNNAATLREMSGEGSGAIAEQIDGTLSKIAAVPKAWGAAVRDTETSTNRFQVQTALANKEFQDYLRTILGANFDDFIGQIRGAANTADILNNRVRALHTSFKNIKEINKAEALRGQENDPIAALRYDFANDSERKSTPENQKQWEIFKTRRQLIGDMTHETELFIAAQQQQAGVLAAGASFLKADTVSLGLYARAIDLANLKLGIQNDLRDRLNSSDPAVKKKAETEVDTRFASASQNYDNEKRRGAVTEVLSTVAAMKERAAMLKMERGLVQQGKMSEQQIADALEIETQRRETLNKLVIAGVPPLMAWATANAIAAGSLGLKQYDAATAKLKEYSALVAQTARTVALAGREQAIYSSTPSYSPDQEKRLAMAREEERLRADEKNKYSEPEIKDRLGEFGKSFDAQARTGAVAEYSKMMGDLQQRMATLGDETGMAALGFRLFQGDLSASLSPLQKMILLFSTAIARTKELREAALKSAQGQLSGAQQNLESRQLEAAGKLSELAKQNLAWKDEDLQRAKDSNAATAEELAIREQIRDVLKQSAQIGFANTMRSLEDQIKALGIRPGKERDRFNRERELEQNPELTPEQRTDILGREDRKAELEALEARWKDSAAQMQGIFRNAIEAGFTDGAKAGVTGFLKEIGDSLLNRGKDILAGKITNRVFGSGAVDLPAAFKVGKKDHIPENVTGLPSSNAKASDESTISTIASALGLGKGGAMSTNVINIQGRIVNVAGGGVVNGTQPSSPQSQTQVLGMLATVITGRK